ncbi:DUF4376 domain-containing protein [Phyllobacterium sp. 22552]|uniref:DUF4376 domain-containing protein n=1 Tax=Phyllobacterium sp. 22552 TaxID=3453941 RepID=UPI003F83A1B9
MGKRKRPDHEIEARWRELAVLKQAVPADAIAITQAQFDDLFVNQSTRKWQDGHVVPYEPPAPEITADIINAERQRRIESGKVISGVLVTGRDNDARNLQALLSVAQIRMAGGDTETVTVFRDGNNVDHELTPPQVVNVFLQSTAFVSEVYAASWKLKVLDPIPADFADDNHWPDG